jgi:hypothetical protein
MHLDMISYLSNLIKVETLERIKKANQILCQMSHKLDFKFTLILCQVSLSNYLEFI